jgi:DNA (cytosine-5)-methyltransferase 1
VRVGSLFTGIGGFDLGLERAGMRVVWQCEQDAYCRRALVADTEHGGPAPRGHARQRVSVRCKPECAGTRNGTGQLLPVPVPYVDVLCGGFPCQDLSYAGKGAGLDGERSGLWAEYARLVRELRPRYVVVENVGALLARGIDVVLGDLAACGYDAEWDCIPASAVGAPHRRDRVWIVAYPDGSQGWRGALRRPGGDGRSGVHGEARTVADAARDLRAGTAPAGAERQRARASGQRGGMQDVADAQGERLGTGLRADGEAGQRRGRSGDGGGEDGGWWLTEPGMGRVAHGIPARVDRLRSLGNSLVPQIAEWIGRRIVEHERG